MYMTKKMREDKKGVSPVVATLMLVLVAVASVTAFYMWQSQWQKDTTSQIGQGGVQNSLNIGGSTTVYDFSIAAIPMYETANPNYKIALTQTGSGSGVTGVAAGALDIGSTSRYMNSVETTTYPELKATVIAWDGVVFVMNSAEATAHAVPVFITQANLKTLYAHAGATPSTATWADLGATTGPTDAVTVYSRSDASGTQEIFVEKMLGFSAKKQMPFTDSGLTYNGNAFVATNTDMITKVQAGGVGFTSYGMTTQSTSTGITVLPVGPAASGNYVAGADNIRSQTYAYSRPLCYITNGAPTGEIGKFIDFCIEPSNNQKICAASGYVSLYK